MPFLLRACFLLPLAALLCMAVRLPAQARDDGKSGAAPTAVSPPFPSENAPEARAKGTRAVCC